MLVIILIVAGLNILCDVIMVKVVRDVNLNPLPCSIYLDGFEIPEYEYLKTRAYSDMDSLGIIVGEEGGGKTAYTLQRALFMDHKFNIDNVVFNEKQFLDATENLPKGSAIVWDESDGVYLFTAVKKDSLVTEENIIQ